MKRIVLSAALLLFCVFRANAQLILMESDHNTTRATVEGEPPFIPVLGVTYDQYAPLPEGTVILCCLGVAYLMKKKKK